MPFKDKTKRKEHDKKYRLLHREKIRKGYSAYCRQNIVQINKYMGVVECNICNKKGYLYFRYITNNKTKRFFLVKYTRHSHKVKGVIITDKICYLGARTEIQESEIGVSSKLCQTNSALIHAANNLSDNFTKT